MKIRLRTNQEIIDWAEASPFTVFMILWPIMVVTAAMFIMWLSFGEATLSQYIKTIAITVVCLAILTIKIEGKSNEQN